MLALKPRSASIESIKLSFSSSTLKHDACQLEANFKKHFTLCHTFPFAEIKFYFQIRFLKNCFSMDSSSHLSTLSHHIQQIRVSLTPAAAELSNCDEMKFNLKSFFRLFLSLSGYVFVAYSLPPLSSFLTSPWGREEARMRNFVHSTTMRRVEVKTQYPAASVKLLKQTTRRRRQSHDMKARNDLKQHDDESCSGKVYIDICRMFIFRP